MNREQYHDRIRSVAIDGAMSAASCSRAQYLAEQLERVNFEVAPCLGALTTPDIGKSAYYGLRVECKGCGFTVEASS